MTIPVLLKPELIACSTRQGSESMTVWLLKPLEFGVLGEGGPDTIASQKGRLQ
jgi:hypothetical protein